MIQESFRESLQWFFAPLLAIVALAWLCVRLEASGVFAAIRDIVRKMSVFQRFAAAAFLAVFIVFAGEKTNSPPMNLPPLPPIFPPVQNPPLPALNPGSPSDAGFVVVGEETGFCVIVPPPVGTVTQETWRLRGAHEDHVRIPSASGWSLLTPSGRVDSLDVLASGGFGVSPCDSFYPPPFADGLSVAPAANWNLLAGEERASIFWHAVTPSNSLIATWQDALLGRSATNIVSFQAEFQPGGGFEYRYADRSVSYSPVPPFDLDGDGLENSVDPDPLVSGPDAHGTNVEWYNIVCSNVLAAAEGQDGVELSWLDGVNSNAYFFAEVVADIGPVAVYFTGDAEGSRLGDPVVVALAGETNRVPLLVGVGYSVSSDVPFSVSASDGVVVTLNGPHSYMVERPVSFEFVPDAESFATGVVAYTVLVDPAGLDGTFAWEGNGQPLANVECRIENGELSQLALPNTASILHSPFSILHSSLGGTSILHSQFSILNSSGGCGFVGFGNYVIFTCGENCDCGGCEAVGSYTYENVYMPVSGSPCGCTPHDDPPGNPDDPPSGGGDPPDPPPLVPSVTVSVDSSVIVFEGEYMDMPGTNVPRRSSYVVVEVDYSAADNDATGTFSVHSGGSHIILHDGATNGPVVSSWPFSVGANATGHHIFYAEGLTASTGAGDVKFKASISDGVTSNSDEKNITVVEVQVEPVEEIPGLPNRHNFGVREMVSCFHYPSSSSVTWSVSEGGTISETSPGFWSLLCNLTGNSIRLSASVGGVSHVFMVNLHEPAGLRCDGVQVIRDASAAPGVAGGAGMALTLYVIPDTVSFRRISVEEVPCLRGSHSGYFADVLFGDRWSHTSRWGAGRWFGVGAGNFWCIDQTRMMVGCWMPPWMQGEMTWAIPLGWNENGTTSGTGPIKNFPVEYASIWTIDSQGTMTKQKHGHIVSRTTNDVVHLDGVLVP